MVEMYKGLVRTRVLGELLSNSCFQGHACGSHIESLKIEISLFPFVLSGATKIE